MPRPAYIICSKSGAVDESTNKLSVFELLDTVVAIPKDQFPYRPVPASKDAKAAEKNADSITPLLAELLTESVGVRVVAVWVREEADTPEKLYEMQFALVAPTGEDLLAFPPATFSFSKPFHRVTANRFPLIGFSILGLYHVEARLRQAGETDWLLRQSYPFLVQAGENTPDPKQPEEQPVA